MSKIEKIIEKAKKDLKKIVLPESNDVRILKAAEIVSKEKIALPVVIGDETDILRLAQRENIDLSQVEIINPLTSERYNNYVQLLYELRKSKGMTLEQANTLVKDYVYFGMCMVKNGDADGLVSGAIHSTADTLRPALQIIKAKDPKKIVSSFFLMNIKSGKRRGEYIFSDCGLNENPSSEELVNICLDSANTCRQLLEEEPVLAMLSYSTYGSAKSESIDKVKNAKFMLDHMQVDFEYDGELQVDAALEPEVAKIKAPSCKISGRPNVLIFPNIEAGNIGYKLVERFAEADAIGPITQGLAMPINDLSRGCKVYDIVTAVAITSVQADKNIDLQ